MPSKVLQQPFITEPGEAAVGQQAEPIGTTPAGSNVLPQMVGHAAMSAAANGVVRTIIAKKQNQAMNQMLGNLAGAQNSDFATSAIKKPARKTLEKQQLAEQAKGARRERIKSALLDDLSDGKGSSDLGAIVKDAVSSSLERPLPDVSDIEDAVSGDRATGIVHEM